MYLTWYLLADHDVKKKEKKISNLKKKEIRLFFDFFEKFESKLLETNLQRYQKSFTSVKIYKKF